MLAVRGGLHVGTRGVNLEEAGDRLPADTLFAALLDTWHRSGGDVAALVAPFVADPPAPPFLLTSAFPYAGGVRFYPMPADLTRLFGPETFKTRAKALKRIRYLSEALLQKALAGVRLDDDLFPADALQEPSSGMALQGGALWLLNDEVALLPEAMRREPGKRHALRSLKSFEVGRVPRVTVDRIGSASTIYHAGRLTFADGCGLWFGASWRTPGAAVGADGPTYRQAFERALAVLQDEGLGGERASGYGAFKYVCAESPVRLPDPAPGWPAWLLSRYHPRQDELPAALDTDGAAYSLVPVGGWLRSPDGAAQRRKQVYMLAEGSLICPGGYPAGDVVDVRPTHGNAAGDLPHPVYRYGLALAAGWSSEKEARNA
jgi:CRISPR-associated protein Csm4